MSISCSVVCHERYPTARGQTRTVSDCVQRARNGNTGDVEEPQIDWSSASVDDGQLTVAVAGEPSKEWTARVERVLDRLHSGGGGWGAIKVTKKKVTVDGVSAGSEAELRHLLESAVLQANADLAPEKEDEGDDERSPEDQQLTDAFRAFAPDDGDDDAD
jgi:hypothetical protein